MGILSINNILYLISNIFNIYVKFRLMGLFFDTRTANKKIEVSAFVAYYLVSSSLHLLHANPILNLSVNVLFFFALTFIYKGTLSVRLISTLLVYCVGMLIESVVYYVLQQISLLTNLKDVSNIISNLLKFMLALILERLFNHQAIQKISTAHWIAIILIPMGSIIIVITNFLSKGSIVGDVANVTILLLVNILVFYLYDVIIKNYIDRYEKTLLKQQNTAYVKQFELIEESQNNVRILKHDMKNHICVIQDMCRNSKNRELLSYINNAFDFIDSNSEYLQFGNSGVDSILNYKINEAKKILTDIKLNVNVPEKINIDTFDLNVILSNLIDNALDALKDINEKSLSIEMEMERNILYITIKNSYCGEILFSKGTFHTTKKDTRNHGIGLSSAESTIKKYNGNLDIVYTDTEFTVSVLLYN